MQSELEKRLIIHEGRKQYAYQDTNGFWTIGIGRNIDSRCGKGLSNDEQEFLLRNDISEKRLELSQYKFYLDQDEVRQEVLIELAFNLGLSGLLRFTHFISAMASKNYKEAIIQLCNSEWWKQVSHERSIDIIKRLETGSYV